MAAVSEDVVPDGEGVPALGLLVAVPVSVGLWLVGGLLLTLFL